MTLREALSLHTQLVDFGRYQSEELLGLTAGTRLQQQAATSKSGAVLDRLHVIH